MDLDIYVTQTVSVITKSKQNIDEFTLNTDLKQYILDESEQLSKNQNIDINSAVTEVIETLGTPEEFAHKVLKEIKGEKRYLIIKILIASFLAFFPFIVLLITLLKL